MTDEYRRQKTAEFKRFMKARMEEYRREKTLELYCYLKTLEFREYMRELRDQKSGKTQPRDKRGRYIPIDKQQIFDAFVSGKDSDEIVDIIIEHHKGLKYILPAEMKKYLEENGYTVTPLGSKSTLYGIPFEQGGGYRTNFGGDAYFQYHPARGSHHDNKEYWKITNGRRGANRYDMDGNPEK